MRLLALLALLAAFILAVHGYVIGEAFGMGVEAVGGGNATPVIPKDNRELAELLADHFPRVILINREFNFGHKEGKIETSGCESDICPVSEGGQHMAGEFHCNWDTDLPIKHIELDRAARSPLKVGSNKSIVGLGNKGVLNGKGLLLSRVTNVIIQNIHITNLNPMSVYGGDGITLQDTDRIWIDHCKFSQMGGHFIVAGANPAGDVTISNNEFDGKTDFSATCNGKQYWAILLIGYEDRYTLSGNYIHDISGRAPRYGHNRQDASHILHAVNNVFENIHGHAFDIDERTWTLMEGNAFVNVREPMTRMSYNRQLRLAVELFNVPRNSARRCLEFLGRACVPNELDSRSGRLVGLADIAAVRRLVEHAGKDNIVVPKQASDAVDWVKANAGVGKLVEKTPFDDDLETRDEAAMGYDPIYPPEWDGPYARLGGQCGGVEWPGPTECVNGICYKWNAFYHQCLDAAPRFPRKERYCKYKGTCQKLLKIHEDGWETLGPWPYTSYWDSDWD